MNTSGNILLLIATLATVAHEKVSPRDIEGCQRILKYFDDLEKQSSLSVKPL